MSTPPLGPYLHAAMRDARMSAPDARGLVPIEEARALPRGLDRIHRKGKAVGGRYLRAQRAMASGPRWSRSRTPRNSSREGSSAALGYTAWGAENLALVERYSAHPALDRRPRGRRRRAPQHPRGA